MARRDLEKLENDLQKEIQRLWDSGQLDGIVVAIKKHFSPRRFFRKYAASLNFDLNVYVGEGNRWLLVPLAGIAAAVAYRGKADRQMQRIADGYKNGQLCARQFDQSAKRFRNSRAFSGVGFGLYPRSRWTGRLRPVR
jgi:hypothetical protein